MVLRKITIDNSVKYVPITEKDIKQNTTKNKQIQPFSWKANKRKDFQKIIKNLLKILQQVDLEYLQISVYMYTYIFNKITYSYSYKNIYIINE